MPELLAPYLAVIAVLTITPGPDMLLVLRNGIRDGSRAAWVTGLGCAAGIAIHAVLAVLGLSAIVAASAEAFTALKIAGAVYLVLLGLQEIAASLRRGQAPGLAERGPPAPAGRSAFVQGLVSNLLNPKIALLFLTLLPQFVADGEPRVATTALLAAIFLAVAVLWWRAFSLAIGPLGRFLSRPRVVAWFDRGTGGLLVALGVRVALEPR
ncbi:MAG TPA: LysE family translocator [Thermoleophilaceae bacterium]|jgi:threonine/homoserine/homoserine lactone efflux protein